MHDLSLCHGIAESAFSYAAPCTVSFVYTMLHHTLPPLCHAAPRYKIKGLFWLNLVTSVSLLFCII